ncbi:uncharacterized protein BO88DRAFT_427231 [Aspergillus vadensis CBS 113365]|uniref:Uncharacterized protein n=1 Tax=Aspergillus vadensis (strain CBS 113365 / IMI 142717 / IBT 24658) TaxID=1448311 RepID=A0A319BMV0_ASPVC|nr:hypothetical protein BO88DRAFT_427231 [Aspergillus vadensis CBS 113365]PYH67023.1 hypothetical protein BO88DRAFT_427231 [Aspergillus vadensis CBS 113365]
MGIYLPCGIALFHVLNSHFYHVAKLQEGYIIYNNNKIHLSSTSKDKLITIFFMVLIWLISRKWHRTWGIPDTEVHGTEMQQKSEIDWDWECSWDNIFIKHVLKYLLTHNPALLQDFSKSLLLYAVWNNRISDYKDFTNLIQEQFHRVLYIYMIFISDHHVQLPINVSSQEQKKLENIFKSPAGLLFEDGRPANPTVPFNSPGYGPTPSASPIASIKGESGLFLILQHGSLFADNGQVKYWGEVPQTFNATVFDRAEESIKYLVLTNTWPKFVRSRGIAAEVDLLAGSKSPA